MIVGGRQFAYSASDVEQAMKDTGVETIREHFVLVNGVPYPPKQVLYEVTGWDRTTFTTMEAQRVLTKLGFECRRAKRNRDGMLAWFDESEAVSTDVHDEQTDTTSLAPSDTDRIEALEDQLAVAQEAIIGLGARVRLLEGT